MIYDAGTRENRLFSLSSFFDICLFDTLFRRFGARCFWFSVDCRHAGIFVAIAFHNSFIRLYLLFACRCPKEENKKKNGIHSACEFSNDMKASCVR